jgi:hypothetical protein
MNNPSLCPCTKGIEKESFYLFIIVFDIFAGGPVGILLSFIALIIFCIDNDYNSKFFSFWAVFRLILSVCYILFLLVVLYFYFFYDLKKMSESLANAFENKALFLTFFILLLLLVIWNIYLSIELVKSVFDKSKDDEIDGELNESQKREKNLNEGEKAEVTVEN